MLQHLVINCLLSIHLSLANNGAAGEYFVWDTSGNLLSIKPQSTVCHPDIQTVPHCFQADKKLIEEIETLDTLVSAYVKDKDGNL